MIHFFKYNWLIRDEWFDLLGTVSHEELIKERVGGLGNILFTLFHIIKVEHNWICDLKGVPIADIAFSSYNDLHKIMELSQALHLDIEEYLKNWDESLEYKELHLTFDKTSIHCTYGEALRHIIAHEIHHIGQLSVWIREIGLKPVSSNLIHKGIMLKQN